MTEKRITTVLFDLDGTVVDTAPDLTAALNRVLAQHQKPPLPLEEVRPHASDGTVALVKLGFGYHRDDPRFEPLREEILASYRDHIADHSTLFLGMGELLLQLQQQQLRLGIVTNKPTALTLPLLQQLQLTSLWGTIVCGDTLPQSKPDPAPLLYACHQLRTEAEATLYVGDAPRDIDAGNRAGMTTIAAAWGYLTSPEQCRHWGASATIHHPGELLALI
ncbi:HAD family hydrolase [Ectothiorhodospiraceae bacterium BW-2]|nr:HAD family hydrolase [Ectothiorhodospiraceae bacterium BW-2]